MCAVDGEKDGRYQVVERLAEGGMAVVDLVVARGPDGFERELVLKRIRPHLSRDPRFARMFIDEARIASQLNHPNIVHISELGKIDGVYFLAMEYVPGVDLDRLRRTIADRGERFPIGLAAFITVEVCRALDYAHHKRSADGSPLRIVHRDVSPQNVLISTEGAVKLADFGIARAAERQEQTLDNVVKGKVAYMSPEQLRGEPLDGRSDLYAVGVTLHMLLSGEHPYAQLEDGLTIEHAIEHAWGPPSETAPDVPVALDDIVARSYAQRREDRYDRAGALAEVLTEHIRDSQLRATAGELAAEMKRLYGEDESSALRTPPVALDEALSSELRRLEGDDGGLPRYTAELGARPDRPTTPARPQEPSASLDLDLGTEPLQAVRWERPEIHSVPKGRGQGEIEAETQAKGEVSRSRSMTWIWLALPTAIIAGTIAAWALQPSQRAANSTESMGEHLATRVAADAEAEESDAPRREASALLTGDADLDLRADADLSQDASRPLHSPRRPHHPRATSRGWLRVVTRPHYAEVFVDGRRRGTTPLLVRVETGRRRLRLVNPQLGRSEQRMVTVQPSHGQTSPATVMVDGF